MNKFIVFSCIIPKDNNIPHVVLRCVDDPGFALFFPANDEIASVLKYIIDGDGQYDINTKVLGIYRTMIDSWNASDNYLSGIIMDLIYDKTSKEDLLSIRLALSSKHTGEIEGLVYVNFINAIMLAALEKVEIIISDLIISKMIPSEEYDMKKNNEIPKISKNNFPEDKNILNIAKEIMSGKIKNNKKNLNKKDSSDNEFREK